MAQEMRHGIFARSNSSPAPSGQDFEGAMTQDHKSLEQSLPPRWKRIVWFASFCAALASALWMRRDGYNAPLTLGVATAIQVALPFVIFKICAAVGIGRVNR